MPMNMPMAASVAPTAARFLTKLPMALNTLNFCFSALAGGSASTRSTVLRIMNWKAAKPITPMISATKNTRVPMMFWFAS